MTYAAVLESGNFTVGQTNGLSGLFVSDNGEWRHLGWENVRCFGLAVRPENQQQILLACGNGVHQSLDAGLTWRILTDWRVTEVLDIVFDPNNEQHLIAASAHGVWDSADSGASWTFASEGLTSRFAQTVSTSVSGPSIWVGTEQGIFRSSLARLQWRPDGLPGVAVRQILTSKRGLQVAVTQLQGAWLRINGERWSSIRGIPADLTCCSVAISADERTIAIGGLFKGVYLSRDGGQTAIRVSRNAPDAPIYALAFDEPGDRIFAGTAGDGLHCLENDTWSPLGLPNTAIRQIA
jgi:hypothetical protein